MSVGEHGFVPGIGHEAQSKLSLLRGQMETVYVPGNINKEQKVNLA